MNFFYKQSKSKKKSIGGCGGWGGGGLGVGADRRTGPNQFALSISSKLGV